MRRRLGTNDRLTTRLALRPFRRRDVESLVTAVQDSLPELSAWLPWVHPGYGRSEAGRFIRDSAGAWVEGRAFDFAIRSRTDPDQHVGNISVWHTSRRERAGEIGYWIRTRETGGGVATEAAARLLEVAFRELELHRVTLRIAVGNNASERVAEKLAFTREGLLRKEVLVNGTWLDHSLWAMLEEEFEAERSRFVAEGWIA